MQDIRGSKIWHKVFRHLIIGIIKKLFDNERTNDHVDRSIVQFISFLDEKKYFTEGHLHAVLTFIKYLKEPDQDS